jgi:hypothetical protein
VHLATGNVRSADGWRTVLEPVVMRYRGVLKRFYFRDEAASANPKNYDFLKLRVSGTRSGCRPIESCTGGSATLPNQAPVRATSAGVRRYYASFGYRARSWKKARRVVPRVQWHPGELYLRVGVIVTSAAQRSKEGACHPPRCGRSTRAALYGARMLPRKPKRPTLASK